MKGSIGHTRLYDLYKYSTLNPFRAEQSSAMKVIAPSHEILYLPDEGFILRHIEAAGRVCYKSEDRITEDSAYAFVQRLLDSGENEGNMKEYALLLHDQCILAEGGHIEDPSLFANRIAAMLSRMLQFENGRRHKQ